MLVITIGLSVLRNLINYGTAGIYIYIYPARLVYTNISYMSSVINQTIGKGYERKQ
jgi:hypothetical protein